MTSTTTTQRISPTHPGELLAEDIADIGVTQSKLARALGVPRSRVNAIINGTRPITADTALRLARFFGTSPEYWLNLQARYDLDVAQDEGGDKLAQVTQYSPRQVGDPDMQVFNYVARTVEGRRAFEADEEETRVEQPFNGLIGDIEIDDRGVVDDHHRAMMWMNATVAFLKAGDRNSAHKLMRALGSLVEFRRFPKGAVDASSPDNFPRWNGEPGPLVVFLGGQLIATVDPEDLLRRP